MIKSMTGFGRGKYQTEGIELLVEIKAVNHRYCDIYLKLPRQLNFLEDKFRQTLTSFLSRGKIEVYVTYVDKVTQTSMVCIDDNLAKMYVDNLRTLQEEYDLIDDISVSLVSKFPDVLKIQSKDLDEQMIWGMAKSALDQALETLDSMRKFEGEKLDNNLKNRIKNVKDKLSRIAKKAPEVPIEYRRRLQERIDDILDGQVVDQNRLAMEVAVYADKCNIDEELERLQSHLAQFLSMLDEDEPIGRKMDFLVQEMNREVNTIGSKANNLDVVKDVVDLKSEIEKIREQIQNIE